MDIKAIVLQTLNGDRRLTRETIAAMTDGDLLFAPTEKQWSFGQQALHLITCQEVLLEAFQGKGWNWEQKSLSLEQYPTQQAILAKFDEVHAQTVAYYENLEPEEFGRMIDSPWGPSEPVLQLFISFMAHEAHHRGQMVAYLRLKGMEPPKY